MDDTTTWRKAITAEMAKREDSWQAVMGCTLSDAELDTEFDNGYGGPEGVPFTLWTARYVYFPVMYDGAEWVESVPRNPCSEATPHLGGG